MMNSATTPTNAAKNSGMQQMRPILISGRTVPLLLGLIFYAGYLMGQSNMEVKMSREHQQGMRALLDNHQQSPSEEEESSSVEFEGESSKEERGGGESSASASVSVGFSLEESQKRQQIVCREEFTRHPDWRNLCEGDIVVKADQLLSRHGKVHIVQIGAHVGFEENDPIAKGLIQYLHLLLPEQKQRFQWTFVEPSKANFAVLQKNVQAPHIQSLGMQFRTINAGVVSDSLKASETQDMIFYSIRDTIDPVTGWDSLSGKQFPYWITQVSSFSKSPIMHNKGLFESKGLNVNDYIVETKVPTKRYSDLMKDIILGDDNNNSVGSSSSSSNILLTLIDTEGFDCPIVSGIAPTTNKDATLYLPHFLMYEHKQCQPDEKVNTNSHLESMGYRLGHNVENTIAVLLQNKR